MLACIYSTTSHSVDLADLHIENELRASLDANATAVELSWPPARTPEAVESYAIEQRDRRSAAGSSCSA